jgi:hypothetical protein
MQLISIEATKDTPLVLLDPSGEIKLEGRSFPENPPVFFAPILEWANGYSEEKMTINVKLDYFNTSTSKQLYKLLEALVKNPHVKDLDINWYYEEGDEDTLETGEHYSDLLETPFSFIEYAESIN